MNAWIFLAAFVPVPTEVIRELDDVTAHFDAATKVFTDDVDRAVVQRYNLRKQSIQRAYEDRIQQLEIEERSKRGNAIATFEAFIRKHPHDSEYTPDALFRLAELYFERSNDEYFVATRAYEEAATQNPDDPTLRAPKQAYPDAIRLYNHLIADFADYRLLDGAYYLLAYCLGEQGEEEKANATYLALVERFATSKFVVEAWTRVGEYYFDRGDLDLAVGAYEHVLAFKQSGFYDKALYKLGWTYFRQDKLDDAVARFATLVDYADAKTGEGGAGGELRGEAIQYLGISFAEERWGGLAKARVYFAANPKPWAHEVLAMLGDVYFDQSKYNEAIAAYEMAIASSPIDRAAPRLRDKVITAYDRMRDFDGAARNRQALSQDYSESSVWSLGNQGDTDALATARDLSERSLLAAAVFHHRQAQALKEQKKDAVGEYGLAALSYDRYLRRFPGAKNRYEMTYNLADCQYYAGQYADAARTYGRVAEDDSNDQYVETAAYAAVVAAEKNVQELESKGQLAPKPVLTSAQRTTPPQAIELSPARSGLVAACDRYVERTKASEKTPAIMFKAGEALYAHDRFDEARTHFMRVMAEHPKSEVARFAANLIIESFLAEKNWNAVEEFSALVAKSGKVGTGDRAFANELEKFKLGAIFKKAEALEAEEKFEEAAAEYLRVVDGNPKADFADKAINNAAVNYEKVRRFESATKLYERISRDYPKSALADTALLRVGLNAERFYDFDKAIGAYLHLVDAYPQSPIRADALYNAALALENTQQYDKAIDEYRRYATLFPDRKDAADVFFRAGRAAVAAGEKARAIRVYEEFIARYKAKAKASDERVVEAYLRIGELDGDPQDAKNAFISTVKEAAARQAGTTYAAEAQFRAAELVFAEYELVPVDGSSKAQKAGIVKRATLLTKARDAYQAVFPFKQIEWTLAALYRIGYLYETFADKLFAAPAPPEVAKLGAEYVEEYRVLIEEQAVPLEDKAVDAYKRALAEAKKSGVANEWTKRTQKSLNKLRKNEFPLQKDARQDIAVFNVITDLASAQKTENRAREELKKRPTDKNLRNRLAEALIAQKKIREAEKLANEVLKFDEKDPGAMLNLSRLYYVQNRLELALLAANNAKEIAPSRGDVYHQLGVLYVRKNERPKALSLFKKAVENDASLIASQINVALLSGEAADFEGALLAAEAAVRGAPESQAAQLALGNALRGVQRYRDAEAAYLKLLEADAKNADATYNLAVLYLDAEIPERDLLVRLDRAAKYFEIFAALPDGSAEEKSLALSYATQAKRRIDAEKKKRDRDDKRKTKTTGSAPPT